MTPAPAQSPEQLEAAYAAYRSATTAWRAAAGVGHQETVDRAADRLLHARVALYRCLTAAGWGPPRPVVVQLERDAALLEAPEDFDALLATIG